MSPLRVQRNSKYGANAVKNSERREDPMILDCVHVVKKALDGSLSGTE